MIPKLRTVMRKLTNKRWYQSKNKIDSTELENELRILRDFRSHLQNICVGCYNVKPQSGGGNDNNNFATNDTTKMSLIMTSLNLQLNMM